jgi:hypothetical protein
MKRKPMLLNKLSDKGKHGHKVTIGVIGAHPGAGVTYTCLMLAFYFSEEVEKKTALLECSGHHDMSLIQSAYEWGGEEYDSFSFHRLTCAKDAAGSRAADILNGGYECFLLDFGSNFTAAEKEFLRCDKKIVIGGRAEWQLRKTSSFIDQVRTIRGSENWLYLIPQAESGIISRLTKETGLNLYAVPFQPEPMLLTKAVNRLFDEIFKLK